MPNRQNRKRKRKLRLSPTVSDPIALQKLDGEIQKTKNIRVNDRQKYQKEIDSYRSASYRDTYDRIKMYMEGIIK